MAEQRQPPRTRTQEASACRVRGRGATVEVAPRFEQWTREAVDDGWDSLDIAPRQVRTTLTIDSSRTIIARNDSPDVPFDRSINPYRGCEHGCVYCFARPSHAWLGLSPGLDFETRLLYKPRAASLLRRALRKPGYRADTLALGSNTDAYQPVERRLALTRSIIEVLAEARHPVTIVTKSALVERDIDLLAPMAAEGLASVAISLTTLDHTLARRMEPRASAPARRLRTIAALHAAGVPVTVLVAPLIPVLNDPELESLLERAAHAGAGAAGYILLRLPREVEPLFEHWLHTHYPDAAGRVLARMRDCHEGKLYDSAFGRRMRGTGVYVQLLEQRFRRACRRLGLGARVRLRSERFTPPAPEETRQMTLF